MRSIRAKLTITILVIVLMALGTLGGLNYWKARQIISDNISTDMTEMAVNSAGNVSAWLESRKGELTMIAAAPAVKGGDLAAIVPYLTNATKANAVYDGINYATPAGVAYSWTGTIFSVADRSYFQRAMRGETAVSDPLVARDTGHLVTAVAIPVKVEGQVAGVLFAGVNMESLNKQVLAIKAGQTGYAFVLQADGLAIIHPSKEQAMKTNLLTDSNSSAGSQGRRRAHGERRKRACRV